MGSAQRPATLVDNVTSATPDKQVGDPERLCKYDGVMMTRDLKQFNPPLWKYDQEKATCVAIRSGSSAWEKIGFMSKDACLKKCNTDVAHVDEALGKTEKEGKAAWTNNQAKALSEAVQKKGKNRENPKDIEEGEKQKALDAEKLTDEKTAKDKESSGKKKE